MRSRTADSGSHYKQQIKAIVERYKREHQEEYVLVVHAIRTKAASLYDTKYGQAPDSGADMRALYEIPVTLSDMLIRDLPTDALTWLSEKSPSRWFARTYKEFALAEFI